MKPCLFLALCSVSACASPPSSADLRDDGIGVFAGKFSDVVLVTAPQPGMATTADFADFSVDRGANDDRVITPGTIDCLLGATAAVAYVQDGKTWVEWQITSPSTCMIETTDAPIVLTNPRGHLTETGDEDSVTMSFALVWSYATTVSGVAYVGESLWTMSGTR